MFFYGIFREDRKFLQVPYRPYVFGQEAQILEGVARIRGNFIDELDQVSQLVFQIMFQLMIGLPPASAQSIIYRVKRSITTFICQNKKPFAKYIYHPVFLIFRYTKCVHPTHAHWQNQEGSAIEAPAQHCEAPFEKGDPCAFMDALIP